MAVVDDMAVGLVAIMVLSDGVLFVDSGDELLKV
jgi:hypothetical protein